MERKQAIVAHACATEASYALAEMERLNVEALAALTRQDNVQLRTFPADLIGAARSQAKDVLGELAGKRVLQRLPRQNRLLVADFDGGGAAGAGGVGRSDDVGNVSHK